MEMLDALEDRLTRISWYLSGSDNPDHIIQQTARKGRDYTTQARLATLENGLAKLCSRSTVIQDLLRLRSFAPTTGS